MTDPLAKAILKASDIIHDSHVLHGDAVERNILIDAETFRVVFIDFSSATINRSMNAASQERMGLKQLLYLTLVRNHFRKYLTGRWARNGYR